MRNLDVDEVLVRNRLEKRGIQGDLYSLLKHPQHLKIAAPVLLALLPELKSPKVKEDLVRIVSRTRISPQPLVEELTRLRPEIRKDVAVSQSISKMSAEDFSNEMARIKAESTGVRSLAWAIGDALSRTADETVFDDLVKILGDPEYGEARQMVPYALARVKTRRDEVIQILLAAIDDQDISIQVMDALGKMGAEDAVGALKRLRHSHNRSVSSTARKALNRIEKKDDGKRVSSSLLDKSNASTSVNFDLDEFQRFLDRLSRQFGAVASPEIKKLGSRLLTMEDGDEAECQFSVVHNGKGMLLVIRVYMSDEDSPDVAFSSEPPLIAYIESELSKLRG